MGESEKANSNKITIIARTALTALQSWADFCYIRLVPLIKNNTILILKTLLIISAFTLLLFAFRLESIFWISTISILFFLSLAWVFQDPWHAIVFLLAGIIILLTINDLPGDYVVISISKVPDNFLQQNNGYTAEVIENRIRDQIHNIQKEVKEYENVNINFPNYPSISSAKYEFQIKGISWGAFVQYLKRNPLIQKIFNYTYCQIEGEIFQGKTNSNWVLRLRSDNSEYYNSANFDWRLDNALNEAAFFALENSDFSTFCLYNIKNKNYNYVLNRIKEIRGLQKDKVAPLYYEGHAYLAKGDKEMAIQTFKLALDYKENAPECLNGLAISYYLNDTVDKAKEYFELSIKNTPDNNKSSRLRANSYYNLAIIYKDGVTRKRDEIVFMISGPDTAEAIKMYKKAIESDPRYESPHSGLAEIYEKINMTREAIIEYKKAMLIDPENYFYHLKLGGLFKEQNQLDDAINQYKKAQLLKPDLADTYLYLGLAYNYANCTREAIKAFRTAIKYQPDFSEAHRMLAEDLFFMGDQKSAYQELKLGKKYKLRPTSRFIYR